LPFGAVHSALPANATLANRKGIKASANAKLHAQTDVMAELVQPMNVVFGFFINCFL